MRYRLIEATGRRAAGLLALVGALTTPFDAGASPFGPLDASAALALPIITDLAASRTTTVVITNTGDTARWLRLTTISGDVWSSTSETCRVTASETTYILIEPTASGATLSFECTTGSPPSDDNRVVAVDKLREGILFVSMESQAELVRDDVLIGEAIVTDPTQGYSYAVEAIGFRGLNPTPVPLPASGSIFHFDNNEYSMFPNVLSTHFMAPTGAVQSGLETRAELILFSLDGTTNRGVGGPRVRTSVKFFNDDELASTNSHVFDCFDIVPLQEIDPRFIRAELGSDVGRVEIHPRIIHQNDTQHDADNGDGDTMRIPALHGWLVETTLSQTVPDTVPVITSAAALGRPLSSGGLPQDVSGADIPTLVVQVPEPNATLVLMAGAGLLVGLSRRRQPVS